MAQGWFGARCSRGLFCHPKNGPLRLIFDTRILNQKFVDPPKTSLPTGAAFAATEVPAGKSFSFGSFDIRNAFYVLEVPEGLSDMFTLPVIAAKHVGVSHVSSGSTLSPVLPSDRLLPSLKVLPMGWSWSLHLCQLFTSTVASRVINPSRFWLDKCAGIEITAVGY